MESHSEEVSSQVEMSKSSTVATSGAAPKPASAPSPASSATQSSPPAYRQNHVSTTMLYGVRIVALLIDEKERLCLAQISNTLLKEYSYNEIHNRRVALGITCVQCTPVQLEILRRAGAMPISSRRCGMITKREAERLVKSFLEETAPPKLPENFAFDVKHECGWGGRGNFIPSRYNSSRAKCLKCHYCNMFFSPNKFIFHYHRMPDSKYSHPDAANFNSWRRHLKLYDGDASDDMLHAWEDVKAMFNGGNRKRVFSGSSFSRPTGMENAKRPKLEQVRAPPPLVRPNNMASVTQPQQAYHYPVFPIANKMYPMKAHHAHPAFPVPFPYEKPLMTETDGAAVNSAHSPNSPWGGAPETMYPPYEMIWAKHLGLSNSESNYATPYQNQKLSPKQLSPYQLSPPLSQVGHDEVIQVGERMVIQTASLGEEQSGDCGLAHDTAADHAMLSNRHTHFSAFRPVSGKTATSAAISPAHEHSPEIISRRNDERLSISPRDTRDLGENVERNTEGDLEEEKGDSDCENVDVDTVDELEENNNLNRHEKNAGQVAEKGSASQHTHTGESEAPGATHDVDVQNSANGVAEGHPPPQNEADGSIKENKDPDVKSPKHDDGHHITTDTEEGNDDSGFAEDSEKENVRSKQPQQSQLTGLSKDELQRELVTQLQTRRRLEEDCRVIKDTFQEQVKREQQYREEMAKQLQIVRETLCHELDQERKARFNLQQKLKEAHDALHNFSCKLLASRECSDCTYKEPMIPR